METQSGDTTEAGAPDGDLVGKIVWGEMFNVCQALGLDFAGYEQVCKAARAMVNRVCKTMCPTYAEIDAIDDEREQLEYHWECQADAASF
jgi:hypothetical protein